MKILREIVAEQMVEIHGISPELAAHHVREMAPGEVKRRFLFYVRPRIAGMELTSIHVSDPQAREMPHLPQIGATYGARP